MQLLRDLSPSELRILELAGETPACAFRERAGLPLEKAVVEHRAARRAYATV
jgi:hypothetical protein